MSRSSPGRYALHEFAKNVYKVRARDSRGRELSIERPNPHQWDIAGHDGTVEFTYTLYADHADGTSSGIDLTHAHLNMPATFAWARGLRERPVEITFQPPPWSDWSVTTQLPRTDDSLTFTAPELDYFMDSPTELSVSSVREWTVTSGDREYRIRVWRRCWAMSRASRSLRRTSSAATCTAARLRASRHCWATPAFCSDGNILDRRRSAGSS